MNFEHSGAAPVYAPNSFGRSYADHEGPVPEGWEADGEMVRQAYILHADDDDWTQAGTLIRDVFDAAARDRFVDTVAGALDGVREDVLGRALQYWKNVDAEIGQRIEAKVRGGSSGGPTPGMEDGVTATAVLAEPPSRARP